MISGGAVWFLLYISVYYLVACSLHGWKLQVLGERCEQF